VENILSPQINLVPSSSYTFGRNVGLEQGNTEVRDLTARSAYQLNCFAEIMIRSSMRCPSLNPYGRISFSFSSVTQPP